MWEVVTTPRHLLRWWGPSWSPLVRCDVDLRPGGAWRYVSRNADVTPSRKARYAAGYAFCLVKLGGYAEAEQPLLEAKAQFESANMSRDQRMRDVLRALADVAKHTGRADEAARWRAESDKLN